MRVSALAALPKLPWLLCHRAQVYAGLNQQTGELMAVKLLQLVSRHGNKDGGVGRGRGGGMGGSHACRRPIEPRVPSSSSLCAVLCTLGRVR